PRLISGRRTEQRPLPLGRPVSRNETRSPPKLDLAVSHHALDFRSRTGIGRLLGPRAENVSSRPSNLLPLLSPWPRLHFSGRHDDLPRRYLDGIALRIRFPAF